MEWWQYSYVFVGVALAGVIDSMAGGGGLITVPIYLSLGLPTQELLGTNKCVSTIGGTMAVFRYVRAKTIFWNTTLYAMGAGMVGAFSGSYCTRYIDNRWIAYLLLIAVPVVLYLRREIQRKALASHQEIPRRQVLIRCVLIGLGIGFYDGFFGPGTGSFLIFAMILALNYSFKEACTNARLVNYASNLAAFFYFLWQGHIHWPVASVALVASLLGNALGSQLALTHAERAIRPAFTIAMLLLLAKSLHSVWGQ